MRKTKSKKSAANNILRIADSPKFQAKETEDGLYSYTMKENLFQFQKGDSVICRDYKQEPLMTSALVIVKSADDGAKRLATIGSAFYNEDEVLSVVVAFRRTIKD